MPCVQPLLEAMAGFNGEKKVFGAKIMLLLESKAKKIRHLCFIDTEPGKSIFLQSSRVSTVVFNFIVSTVREVFVMSVFSVAFKMCPIWPTIMAMSLTFPLAL